MSVNGYPKSLWTVEVLFPISVLANFLPVCVATTQVLACHCSNSSIMKKNARIFLEEGKARYVVSLPNYVGSVPPGPCSQCPGRTLAVILWSNELKEPCDSHHVSALLMMKRGTSVAEYRRHDCGPVLSSLYEKSSPTFLESRTSEEVVMNTQGQTQWSRIWHRYPHASWAVL